MSTVDVIEVIRREVSAAFSTAQGGDAKIEVTGHTLSSLLRSLEEQEAQLLALERENEDLRKGFDKLSEMMEYYDVNEVMPEDLDLYECFVGENLEEGGRIFLFFDPIGQLFFREEGDKVIEVDNVLYWRHSMPNPDEEFDL